MSDHYYTKSPRSEHKPAHIDFAYRGHSLAFLTDSGVFSRLDIDRGTELLLNALPDPLFGNVLDMGCGYGAIGCSIGKAYPACTVTMCDINERAVSLSIANARQNGVHTKALQSDGYTSLGSESFDFILQNPPIRAGKQVMYQMFADASSYLSPKGELWLVIRKQQGAPSAVTYLKQLFAQVMVVEKKSGYWILCCQASLCPPKEGEHPHGI